jgi:autotransporter-associated beta strand protein
MKYLYPPRLLPRHRSFILGKSIVLGIAALTASNALAATYYWDTNGAIPGSGAATGTWDSGVSALWTTDSTGSIATVPVTTAADSDLIFSAGANGTAGTITISGTQLANSLTFSQPGLTLSGGGITLTNNNPATPSIIVQENTIINAIGNLAQFSAISVAAGKTLTLSSTNTAAGSNNFFLSEANVSTGGIVGGGTVKLTGGTFTTQSNPFIKNGSTSSGGLLVSGTTTLAVAGGLQVGRDATAGRVEMDSSTAAINMTGQLTVGRGTSGNYVQGAGAFNSTHNSVTDSSVLVGREGNGIGTLNVSGGTFNVLGGGVGVNTGGVVALNANGTSATNSGTLNISGGVVQIKELSFNRGNKRVDTSTAGSGNLNLSGGALYIGGLVTTDATGSTTVAGGINNYGSGTSTYSINLSGGTLGANADWNSSMNMTLGTSGGGVTIKAADAGNVAHNITLSGVLSGAGGLVKGGAGSLTLSGTNTYSGLTSVTAGTLILGTFSSINDLGSLCLADGSTLSLTFSTGSETVYSLFNSTTGTFVNPGTYSASSLAAALGGLVTVNSAGGTITVTAVPEPTTWAMLTVSLVMISIVIRRRSRRVD